MRSGYVWIEYVSFEHEIEHRKKEYYKKLMDAQRNRPGEEVAEWVNFFLDCLKNIQDQLLQKVKEKEKREQVGVREQHIYALVENNPGISSGEVADKLKMPNSTVKRILADLVAARNLIVHGAGRGTRYSISAADLVKRNMAIILNNEQPVKEITFPQLGAFIEIKRIVLTPLFEWKHPNEWRTRLSQNGLHLEVSITTSQHLAVTKTYAIAGFDDPSYFQPVLIVHPNIEVPGSFPGGLGKVSYPVKCTITLKGSVDRFDFNVMLVTDEG